MIKNSIRIFIGMVAAFVATNGYCNSPNAFFSVADFGAVGDGKTLDSPAINRAIDAAVENGGGTVYLPSGSYLSGSIHMQSNINLHLSAGCVIVGAPHSMGAYDPPEEFDGVMYQDSGHTFFHNSLIWGVNLKNVSITGQGMIDGGDLSDEEPGGPNSHPPGSASKAIALKLCSNVLIRDITVFHGGHFAIILTGCNMVTLDNLIIDTNRDGVDIDCCTNVIVSNCKVNSPHDDAIVLKSSYALGRRWITENLTITNCQVSGFVEGTLLDGTMVPYEGRPIWGKGYGRIKFGTESNGGFRNVSISNCTFRSCKGIALEQVDGGVLENFTITGLAMYDIYEYPIYITLGERMRDPDSTRVPVGKNIIISDVVATMVDSLSGIHITGTPKFFLENIKISNVILTTGGGGAKQLGEIDFPELGKGYPEIILLKSATPSYGFFARHVKNLEIDNVRVEYLREDKRPAIVCIDIDGLVIDKFKAEVAEGTEAGIFKDVKNLNSFNSPVLNDVIKKMKQRCHQKKNRRSI